MLKLPYSCACSGDPLWTRLSPDQQQKFKTEGQFCAAGGEDKDAAKRRKGEVRSGGLDSLGRSLADIRRRDTELRSREVFKQTMPARLVEEARKRGKLREKTFYIIR